MGCGVTRRAHLDGLRQLQRIVMRRRYLAGIGQHTAMRSGPCMRKPFMTSPRWSQIVATPGPEAFGTTEFPSRQPWSFNSAGTDGAAVTVAANAASAMRTA